MKPTPQPLKISPQALLATVRLNLLRRPLWPMSMAQIVLDIPGHQLERMMNEGKLPWVFNLSNAPTRQELRIWGGCVVECLFGPLPEIGAARNLNLPEVVDLILPQRRTFRGAELQQYFACHRKLIVNLARRRKIQPIKEALPASGPNSSPRFTRESLAKYLTLSLVC